ncbi:hypothetical protein, partial [Pseudomonas aeruginosa]|uniref:hypothetical protein n=1 Tax=Pseudomonas aeruginosa TaxID=287 RepID=UPI003978845C
YFPNNDPDIHQTRWLSAISCHKTSHPVAFRHAALLHFLTFGINIVVIATFAAVKVPKMKNGGKM